MSKCQRWNVKQNYMRILSILLICTVIVRSKIVIEDANIAALSHDDIGMIFYVALRNTDTCAYNIITRMVKCVEEIEANDKDCEMMQLIGGDMGVLRPRCSKNITLIYPNMYLINRRGYCIIAIKFISEDNQMLEKKTNISFNTYTKGTRYSCLANGFCDVTAHKALKVCGSVDEDPLNNCEPVDCHMKYVGTRSYYNKRWKRCQKVPKCVYDPDKELPDVGYTPITNKCLDLERCIRRAELTPLENKFAEMQEENKYSMILTTMHCHHGKPNNNTGLCDCDPGWGSSPFEPIPSLFTFHMCNIEKSTWYDSNRSMVTFIAFFISISSVSVAILVVLVSFVLYHLYKCLRKGDRDKAKDVEDEEKKPVDRHSDNDSYKSKRSGERAVIGDTNKVAYAATDPTRIRSSDHTDTRDSELSKESKISNSKFSDSTDSKTSKESNSRDTKSLSTGLTSTDKSSKDALRDRSTLSSGSKKK